MHLVRNYREIYLVGIECDQSTPHKENNTKENSRR